MRAVFRLDRKVLFALLLVQLIFGLNHVVAKAVLAAVSPRALAAVRVLVSTPLLLLWAWVSERCRPSLRQLPRLAVLGVTGVFANQVLFLEGLARSSATHAAILMPSIPVLAVGASLLLRIERPDRWRLLGVALAVLGALVMLRPHRVGLGGAGLGDLLLLCNCASYALFLVLQRPVLRELPWRTVIAWAFLLGGILVVATSWRPLLALPLSLPPQIWAGVAYVAVLATGVAYLLNTWALRRSSPLPVAVSITLQPAVAAAGAALFLHEAPGWVEGAGFVLIVGGLLLTAREPADSARGV
jgi:drug/metabolite transporter (DMT)-like permease